MSPSPRRSLLCLLVLALVAGLATTASADVQGASGRLVSLLIIEPTSDDYAVRHGSVTLGDSIGGFATYWWGGSYCPGKDLLATTVEALHHALDNPRVVVQPFTKNGQGGALCLVAVRFTLRSEQGLFP